MFGFPKKKEVVGVLDFFLSILKKYEEKNLMTCFFYVGPWVLKILSFVLTYWS
jgi:hypothetical protein